MLNFWLLVMLVLGIVVPYDARYRLPAAPAIIIMASGLLVLADWRSVFSPRRAWAILRSHPKVAVLTFVLCVWVLIGAYTPNIPPLLQSLYQAWRGDTRSSSSDALGHYNAAIAASPTFYWPYRHEADAFRLERQVTTRPAPSICRAGATTPMTHTVSSASQTWQTATLNGSSPR